MRFFFFQIGVCFFPADPGWVWSYLKLFVAVQKSQAFPPEFLPCQLEGAFRWVFVSLRLTEIRSCAERQAQDNVLQSRRYCEGPIIT